jgi:tetratricopeptide (TPR) repeat protein
MHRETIAASERIDGELHPNTVIRISNLALVQIRTSQLAEALETIKTALERGRQSWPEDHPQIASMLATEGAVLKRLGRMKEALSSHEASTDMARRTSGVNSANYARRLRALGSMQRDLRQFAAAEQSLNEAQRIVTGLYGADSAQPQLISIVLGQLHNDQGAFSEAETYLKHGLSRPDSLGRMTAVIGQREIGRSLSGQGRFNEAEQIIRGALADREALTSENDPGLVSFLATASEHYRRAGDLQEALSHAERAAMIADTVESPGWLDVAAYAEYAKVLVALGEQEKAESYFRRAQDILEKTFGEDDDRVRGIEAYLVD